jgi:hypothetical protein
MGWGPIRYESSEYLFIPRLYNEKRLPFFLVYSFGPVVRCCL